MRIIPIELDNKNILVQKTNDRYIREDDLKLAIQDIINDNQLDLIENMFIDLSKTCDLMFSIVYKGIIKTIKNINNKEEITIDNIVFEVC
jgi:hypothetical protein